MSLLDTLEKDAVDLLDQEIPSFEKARPVLGALVRRVEAIEKYLSSQAESVGPQAPAPGERVSPAPAAPAVDLTGSRGFYPSAAEPSAPAAAASEPPAAAPAEPEPVSRDVQPWQPGQ